MTKPVLALLVVSAVVAAAAAPPATAAPPPRGKYGCTIGGIFGGNLYILRDQRYRVNSSRTGRFRMVGRRMRFRSGVWKGLWRGRWHRTDTGKIEIELTSIESGFTSGYCTLEKRA